MPPEEQTTDLAIQRSAKHISFWISFFGWLYVISWINDTMVILSGETKLVNYLWFCQRGVIGISFIFLAKRIKRLPTNTVALLTVVWGILIVRAVLMVFDREFGNWHLINLFDETYSPGVGVVCGWGAVFALISYVWKKRREYKETQVLFPQIFNGTANLKTKKRKSSTWKYILAGTILTLLTMFGCSVVLRLLKMQPFVNVTENYIVTQVQAPKDSRIPYGWTRYAIGDLATIDIPPSMELRTDEHQLEMMKQVRAQTDVRSASIVFQQLGYISQTGRSKYARVMISVYEDTFDFGSDLPTLSNAEKAQFDVQEQKRWQSGLPSSSAFGHAKIISLSKTIFGESYTQNSYTTQLGNNPIVCGNLFAFYGCGMKVEVKLLHRVIESEYFQEDFARIPHSFQFN
ncbi:MAG: hypothetical protein WC340_11115 [Kiritimatiellia bacterium]